MNKLKYVDENEFVNLPTIINVETVSNILGISRAASYNLFASKGFPSITVGGRKMIIKSNFLKWLDNAHQKN